MMKTIILAGGLGTRLAEETGVRPKPMVEIGDKPILWHIMNIYGTQGFNNFIVALGYKGEMIKKYFYQYSALDADLKIDLGSGICEKINSLPVNWKIELINTGLNTLTGGRIKRLKSYVNGETFIVTYGDGVANIDLKALLAFHRAHGKLATVTAVKPPSRFGKITTKGGSVKNFSEKSMDGDDWINGGFYVFEPGIFDYIQDDLMSLEREPMERLTREGQLMAFQHQGFWHMMDTLPEKLYLESLWNSGNAPWMETLSE